MADNEYLDELAGEVSDLEHIEGDLEAEGDLDGDVEIPRAYVEKDYEQLDNKPSINGTELIGNYDEIDPTVPEWAKESTKPAYTYEDTGSVGGENQVRYDEIDRMFNAVFGIGQ